MPKNAKIFTCEICDFNTSKKSNFTKHMATRKHKILTNTYKKMPKILTFDCPCGKKYKHRQSLHNHKKTCTFIEADDNNENENNSHVMDYDTCINIIKNEVIPKMQVNNTINHNNYNLNLFLNETCKNAINMSDFIKKIKVGLQELEFTKKNGIVDGISNIFLNSLKNLEIEQRPIHCTDSKLKTLYIKEENKWEKDPSTFDESINTVKNKHADAVKEWEVSHPNWNQNDKETQEYIKMVQDIVNDISSSDEQRIIQNISNEVKIDEMKEN